MKLPTLPRSLAVVLALCAVGTPLLYASASDHEDIRRLREAGEVLSLEEILQRHRAAHPAGHILEIELEREHDRLVYEVKVLDADSAVRSYQYDARDGRLLREKAKRRRAEDND